jgi:ABC-type lipoprotein export system ATPase subunit
VELSGGEQQRAAFAQALATGAGIIVADEPTAELDGESSRGVLDRVRALADEGVTFLLATHDPAVMAIADERFELEHGRVRGMARTDEAGFPVTGAAPELRWPEAGSAAWLFDAEPVVRLRGVSKSYGRGDEAVHALRAVDLEARTGEVVGLIGRSGSGKTTLLNVAAGWETPDTGSVEWPGDHRDGWSDIAVLPQRLGLMEELSAQENIEYRRGSAVSSRTVVSSWTTSSKPSGCGPCVRDTRGRPRSGNSNASRSLERSSCVRVS